MSPRGRRITASQVGQYVYCAHAWWLAAVEKCEPSNLAALEAGTRVHERHGWRVRLARGVSRLALAALGMALICLLFWVLAGRGR
jgi:CRISPR/Cas system-associated exonuclease Cas4 (RecB family)